MERSGYRLRVLRAPKMDLAEWLVKSGFSLNYRNTALQRFIPPICASKRQIWVRFPSGTLNEIRKVKIKSKLRSGSHVCGCRIFCMGYENVPKHILFYFGCTKYLDIGGNIIKCSRKRTLRSLAKYFSSMND